MFWRKRKKEEPSGQIKVTKDKDGFYVVTIRGKMSAEMWKRLENLGAKVIGKVGTVRILMNLEDFQGWMGRPGDGNIDFLL